MATLAVSEMVISKDCCLDSPLESETAMAKLDVPVAVGVPEMIPDVPPRAKSVGSSPEARENL